MIQYLGVLAVTYKFIKYTSEMQPARYLVRCITLMTLMLTSCFSNNDTKPDSLDEEMKSLAGIYTIYTKGIGWKCETVKHYFEIKIYKKDSSFLYHAFCNPNNLDPAGVKNTLQPKSVIGKWTYGSDSLIRLQAYNGNVVKLKVSEDGTIDTFKDNGERLYADIYFDASRIYP